MIEKLYYELLNKFKKYRSDFNTEIDDSIKEISDKINNIGNKIKAISTDGDNFAEKENLLNGFKSELNEIEEKIKNYPHKQVFFSHWNQLVVEIQKLDKIEENQSIIDLNNFQKA